jgi:methanogenic corrinoid protein MtbC1
MEERLKAAILGMRRQEAVDLVIKGIESGANPLSVLKMCTDALEEVGRRFETKQFFLSELIYSGEVFKEISSILDPNLKSIPPREDSRAVVVFGTPEGDIHDLGKNIVITLMRAQGITVHDLGVDVPARKFIEELQRWNAGVLAMSALITPAFGVMKEVNSLLKETGLRDSTYVIIGGAVTNELARKEVGADAQTVDPTEGVRLCRQHFAGKK